MPVSLPHTLSRVIVKDSYTGKDLVIPTVARAKQHWRENAVRNCCPHCRGLAETSAYRGEVPYKDDTYTYRCVVRQCGKCSSHFYLVVSRQPVK